MIDKNLIKDDLYEAVNKEYLANLEIPEDKTSIGAFVKIAMDIEELLLNDFKTLNFDDEFVTPEMVHYLKFYRSIIENKNREVKKDGEFYKIVDLIKNFKTKEELNTILIKFREIGLASLFNSFVYSSFKDADKNILYVDVPDTILPSKEFYVDDLDRKNQLLNEFKKVVTELFEKFEIENAKKYLNLALELDEETVNYMKSAEELADYTKMYNKISYSDLQKTSNYIDFKANIEHFIKTDLDEISITQPIFFENLNNIYNDENVEKIRALLLVKFVYHVSDLFTEDMRIIKARYENILKGIKEPKNTEKFAFEKAMELFSEVVGLYYGHKYFGEEAKKDIYDIVNKIIAMYQKRLKENTWLREETKEKAILKLSNISVMLGYPDKMQEVYKKITYNENENMFENYIRNIKIHELDKMQKYNTKVDHNLWGMPACTVNAYYNATDNNICFPAAILNKPFYSLEQTKSQNFGGIGAVIGHEISHAFDNNGAQFDEKGNLNNWWHEDDYKEFKKLTEKMIKQFDGVEIYGGKVNGTLVVSENLADVGGLACAIACLKEEENYNLAELFENFARVWAFKGRDEYKKLLLKIDVHAPTKLRANMQPSNMDEFYETYDIKENDGMYRAKEDRIIVW